MLTESGCPAVVSFALPLDDDSGGRRQTPDGDLQADRISARLLALLPPVPHLLEYPANCREK